MQHRGKWITALLKSEVVLFTLKVKV